MEINNLLQSIACEESKERIETIKEELAALIDDLADNPNFFSLSTDLVLDIIKKSRISDINTAIKIVSMMNQYKGNESPLVLNVIDFEDGTFDDFIDIISNFKSCPICKRMFDYIERSKTLPKRDYEDEIRQLNQRIEELNSSLEEVQREASSEENMKSSEFIDDFPPVNLYSFQPVTAKPRNFEKNIFNAAKNGNLPSLQYLVEVQKVNIMDKDEYGRTPLYIAVENGRLQISQYLIEECAANVDDVSNNGDSIIKKAIENGHIHLVQYLMERCNVRSIDKYGNTLLHIAACHMKLQIVQYLVKRWNYDANQKNNSGYTPLHEAAYGGYLSIIQYLVMHGNADVNQVNNEGQTALYLASMRGRLSVVQFLVEECNATVTQKDVDAACSGWFLFGAKRNKNEILRILNTKLQ